MYMFNIYVFLFIWEREKQLKECSERALICWFILWMPTVAQAGPGPKPRARLIVQVPSMWAARTQLLGPALLHPEVCVGRKLDSGTQARNPIQAGTLMWGVVVLTTRLKVCSSVHPFKGISLKLMVFKTNFMLTSKFVLPLKLLFWTLESCIAYLICPQG